MNFYDTAKENARLTLDQDKFANFAFAITPAKKVRAARSPCIVEIKFNNLCSNRLQYADK